MTRRTANTNTNTPSLSIEGGILATFRGSPEQAGKFVKTLKHKENLVAIGLSVTLAQPLVAVLYMQQDRGTAMVDGKKRIPQQTLQEAFTSAMTVGGIQRQFTWCHLLASMEGGLDVATFDKVDDQPSQFEKNLKQTVNKLIYGAMYHKTGTVHGVKEETNKILLVAPKNGERTICSWDGMNFNNVPSQVKGPSVHDVDGQKQFIEAEIGSSFFYGTTPKEMLAYAKRQTPTPTWIKSAKLNGAIADISAVEGTIILSLTSDGKSNERFLPVTTSWNKDIPSYSFNQQQAVKSDDTTRLFGNIVRIGNDTVAVVDEKLGVGFIPRSALPVSIGKMVDTIMPQSAAA